MTWKAEDAECPGERHFLAAIVAQIAVDARDRAEARDLALAELAHRCEYGGDLRVHIEEVG